MNPHYHTDYTWEDIASVLAKIQSCITSGHFIISVNDRRQENMAFIRDYELEPDRQKELLMQIEPSDFCHSLQNTKPGYEHEELFVFVSQVHLINFFGDDEIIHLYTKFNIIERSSHDMIIVISFHPAKKPFDYVFTDQRKGGGDDA